jgi:hypothetical protein
MTFYPRHGGPYDRGSADAYCGRPYNPHFYVGPTYASTLVEKDDMTPEQINEYDAGWYGETERKYG